VIPVKALPETVESTLSARRGSGRNQGAHQLLRELRLGSDAIWNLNNIPADEKRVVDALGWRRICDT
jgi:hypothetical protein